MHGASGVRNTAAQVGSEAGGFYAFQTYFDRISTVTSPISSTEGRNGPLRLRQDHARSETPTRWKGATPRRAVAAGPVDFLDGGS